MNLAHILNQFSSISAPGSLFFFSQGLEVLTLSATALPKMNPLASIATIASVFIKWIT